MRYVVEGLSIIGCFILYLIVVAASIPLFVIVGIYSLVERR